MVNLAAASGSLVSGNDNVAIGTNAGIGVASNATTSIGLNANASAANAIAMGTSAVANSADAVAIGTGSTATGGRAVAIGAGNVANGIARHGRVDATLVLDSGTYLFSGNQYVRYDGADLSTVADGYPRSLDALRHEPRFAALP